MKKTNKILLSDRGFTLIEVIASLVLFVIIATAAGFGFIEITKQYIFSKNINDSMLETQFAFEKISKFLTSVNSSGNSAIKSGVSTTITIEFDGTAPDDFKITYDPVEELIYQVTDEVNTDKLVGNVVSFEIEYCNDFDEYSTGACMSPSFIPSTTSIVNLKYEVRINDSVDKSFNTIAYVGDSN